MYQEHFGRRGTVADHCKIGTKSMVSQDRLHERSLPHTRSAEHLVRGRTRQLLDQLPLRPQFALTPAGFSRFFVAGRRLEIRD